MKQKIDQFGKWLVMQANRWEQKPTSEKVQAFVLLAAFVFGFVYMGSYGTATAYGANSLNINSTVITNGLFEGANIIIGALGAVVFLLIGFTFGAKILAAIGAFVQRIAF